ncbi:response regulator [Vibrio sp. JCM 19052]|nr:response regulator [Vibrio sp. JCM 19052]
MLGTAAVNADQTDWEIKKVLVLHSYEPHTNGPMTFNVVSKRALSKPTAKSNYRSNT